MSNIPVTDSVGLFVGAGPFRKLFKRTLLANALFITIAVVYFLAAMVFLPVENVLSREFLKSVVMLLFGAMVPIALFSVFVVRAVHVARFENPEHPLPAIFKDFWQVISNPCNLALSAPVFLLTAVFFRTYVSFKSGIPDINPFSWDTTFYQWDKVVHFGIDPWKIVHPVISLHPWLTSMLSINYTLWFLFTIVIWGTFVFGGKYRVVRTRFLLTFFLVWAVGGSLFAVLFSSVGPVFSYALGLSPDFYGDLLAHLRITSQVVSLGSVGLQDVFLNAYQNNGVNLGISAMPSIHNAIAMLLVLGAWQINRKFGVLMVVHWFLVYVASFYLAWHYAIDAYAGWVLTLVFWYVCGFVARWWHKKPFMQELDASFAASLSKRD